MAEGHFGGLPVMSGSTSSGPGPNCEIDVMGHSTKSLRDNWVHGVAAEH
jgi:hypothetical protein